MLQYFEDWTRVELSLYEDATSYNPTTGQVESGYKENGTIKAFVFQSSAMQGVVSDKIVDQSDYIVVYENEIPKTALMYFNKEWYQVVGADDVLFQDCVWVYGLKRTEKPEVTNE